MLLLALCIAKASYGSVDRSWNFHVWARRSACDAVVTYVGRRWLRGAHAAAVGLRTLVWFPLLLQFSIRNPTFWFYGHVAKIQAGTNQLRPSRFRQDRITNQIGQALS